MKSLRALPILLLALTTAGGHPPQKPRESSDKTKASSGRPKEFREPIHGEPPKIDPKGTPEHPLSVTVRLDAQERVYVNKELVGSAGDAGKLRRRIVRVFREKRRWLDGPRGAEIDAATRESFKSKHVTLYAPSTAKYGTVVKVLDALKAAGCRVGLVVDDPPAPPDK